MLDALSARLLEADGSSRRPGHRAHGRRRAFCAGLDPAGADSRPDGQPRHLGALDANPGELDLRNAPPVVLHNLDTPTICSLNGERRATDSTWRSGAISASPGSRPSSTRIRQGDPARERGTWLLPRMLGYAKAAEVAFTGRTLLAKEAHELGLVNCAVADADLPAATAELAGEIAANAPLAVRAIKRMMRAVGDRDLRAERSPRVPPTPTAAPHAGLPGRCGGVHGEAPARFTGREPALDEATTATASRPIVRLADRPPGPTHLCSEA